jgi:arylsulfatase A-like enzyme
MEGNKKVQRPNILFIMVDEMRYPTSYETKAIKEWRNKYLTAQKRLKKEGVEFINHYTGSTACAPARATIFTGQYPTLHGVSQTNGAAKSAHDPDMFWLDPNTVPDMGDYFKELNYKTLYKGKWHISEADIIIPGTTNSLPSYNQNGTINEINTEIYRNANKLKDFGFNGWIGPEPHGPNPLNSGSSSSQEVNGRDIVYVDEVIELLQELGKCKKSNPWLMVASLVNPHDITLWGEFTSKLPVFNFDIDPSVPNIPPAPTANEDLSTKPKCQASYKERYQEGFQPTIDNKTYRQLYYSLNLTADRNVNKILDALDANHLTDDTIVVFTSDHGDYLGAHGLFQKWYTAYEEAIHVPLIIRFPSKIQTSLKGKQIDSLTSHLDILPTLLGLVNADTQSIQKNMKTSFTEVRPFVGHNLTPLIYGKICKNKPQLFITDDNVLLGYNMTTLTGKAYQPVRQPASIQTIITEMHSHKYHETNKKIWKYSRYYDNPQFWTNPNTSNVITIKSPTTILPENNNNIQVSTETTITETKPFPDEFELYCLTDDPFETTNLANPKYATKESKQIQKVLAEMLTQQVNKKCLKPSSTNPNIFPIKRGIGV